MAGLNIDSASSATGTGVSFYNTTDPDDNYDYKPLEIQSGSTVQFSAPSGTNTDFDGILFWQDHNVVGGLRQQD